MSISELAGNNKARLEHVGSGEKPYSGSFQTDQPRRDSHDKRLVPQMPQEKTVNLTPFSDEHRDQSQEQNPGNASSDEFQQGSTPLAGDSGSGDKGRQPPVRGYEGDKGGNEPPEEPNTQGGRPRRSNTQKLQSANSSAEQAISRGRQKFLAYGHHEKSYNTSLKGALEGRTLTDTISSFETPTHTPIVIDLLAPTDTLRDIASRVPIRGLAIGLLDDRKPSDIEVDTKHHLTQQAANILRHRSTWDGIRDWVRKQGVEGADVVICRPGGPLHFLTNSPEVLFGLLDRAYRTARPDGGIVITNTPKPGAMESLKSVREQLGIPPRPGIEGVTVEDIFSWVEMINSSDIGIQVKYFHSDKTDLDSLKIIRSKNSPDRLPTMRDLRLRRINKILGDIRTSLEVQDSLLSELGEDVGVRRILRLAQGKPDAIARSEWQIDQEQIVSLHERVAYAIQLEDKSPSSDNYKRPTHQDFDLIALVDRKPIVQNEPREDLIITGLTPENVELAISLEQDNFYLRIGYIPLTDEGLEYQYNSSILPLGKMTREEYEVISYCVDRYIASSEKRIYYQTLKMRKKL